ncbi:uncharacterized protein LOC121383559 [Gigantopelta aegis]|uniref:uncharacterized protein LOC121383559 n=1 Tax=Gigantopelta aegis TaxID=1735272 RepID=UPI001B88895E|nr:uncharacterized protein LOC121383559 [Gigantopelta aegis]
MVVLFPGADGQVILEDLCSYDNQTVPTSGGFPLQGQVMYQVSQSAITSSGPPPVLGSPDTVEGNGVRIRITGVSNDSAIVVPDVIITKTLQMVDATRSPPLVFFRTELLHSENSTESSISDVLMDETMTTGMLIILGTGFVPGIFAPNLTNNGRVSLSWYHTSVASNDSRVIEYQAEPDGSNGGNLAAGQSWYWSSISFRDVSTSLLIAVIENRTEPDGLNCVSLAAG